MSQAGASHQGEAARSVHTVGGCPNFGAPKMGHEENRSFYRSGLAWLGLELLQCLEWAVVTHFRRGEIGISELFDGVKN